MPQVWTWLAATLNPHYEGNDLGYMINDDRFIMGRWVVGEEDDVFLQPG